ANPEDALAPTEKDDPISQLLHHRDQVIRQAFEGVTLRSLASQTSALDAEPETSAPISTPSPYVPDHVLEQQRKQA
ncbi:MAG: hypothetical protein ACRERD_22320, partial [Candidatus Binatia bacterium]